MLRFGEDTFAVPGVLIHLEKVREVNGCPSMVRFGRERFKLWQACPHPAFAAGGYTANQTRCLPDVADQGRRTCRA
jgi:hypothetical protein